MFITLFKITERLLFWSNSVVNLLINGQKLLNQKEHLLLKYAKYFSIFSIVKTAQYRENDYKSFLLISAISHNSVMEMSWGSLF